MRRFALPKPLLLFGLIVAHIWQLRSVHLTCRRAESFAAETDSACLSSTTESLHSLTTRVDAVADGKRAGGGILTFLAS